MHFHCNMFMYVTVHACVCEMIVSVHLYTCMHVCIYTCMCMHMQACVYVSVSLGFRVSASMCLALRTIMCTLVGINVVGPISLFRFLRCTDMNTNFKSEIKLCYIPVCGFCCRPTWCVYQMYW